MTKSSRVWGTGGRWAGHSSGAYFRTDDRLALGLYSYDTYFLPRRIRNLRLDTFRVTYKVGRYTALGNPYWAEFNFNIKDEDEHLGIWVKHTTSTAVAPVLKQFVDGGEYSNLSCTTDAGEAVSLTNWSDPLWVRVVVDPDDGQSEYVKVYESTTEGGLDSANECLIYSGAVTLDGGQLGFGAGFGLTVDEIKIEVPDGQGGWDTEFEEEFTVDANNRTENDSLAHDAARNLTYDGRHKFVYDAWNRLVEVKRAYRNATSPYTLNETSSIATLSYDGLGRRISKAVTNSADWNATYHYYYDGSRMIETHDGSADVLKQHVWGMVYVDELVQIGINDDPTDAGEDDCETFYYPLQDANFNVLGLADSDGDLVERYEYSPYGQRTVYKSAGPDDPLCSAPILESQPHPDLIGSLCDIGHQGLLHDKEFGLIYNRARYLHPLLGRFLQRDPLRYVDGLNLYEYVGSTPVVGRDPFGRSAAEGWGGHWTQGGARLELARQLDEWGAGRVSIAAQLGDFYGTPLKWKYPVMTWQAAMQQAKNRLAEKLKPPAYTGEGGLVQWGVIGSGVTGIQYTNCGPLQGPFWGGGKTERVVLRKGSTFVKKGRLEWTGDVWDQELAAYWARGSMEGTLMAYVKTTFWKTVFYYRECRAQSVILNSAETRIDKCVGDAGRRRVYGTSEKFIPESYLVPGNPELTTRFKAFDTETRSLKTISTRRRRP